MTYDLTGKTALITGGSRSLGRATALRLAREGADVILTHRSKAKEAEAVVAEIEAMGRKAAALQVDLEGTAAIPDFVERLAEAGHAVLGHDRIDVLVNNAGVERGGVFGTVAEADWDAIMDTNLKSAFFLTQALQDRINDDGRILFLGTGLTRFALPPYVAYAASKAALSAVALYLAKTLGPRGITVNVVAPGALDTDFNRANFDAHPEVVNVIAGNTAQGRVGRADDVEGVIAFLTSPSAQWVTGQRLEASGGMFL
ncbi:SDR family oxidoreductase [uncultured Tateyamaria sp.]|uniref:SDR family NAD(P)-dependent oxidoreductase n=1 Tax=uncultured Tateyamaria sp. TaxID=455651 RepID=UPI00262A7759|nr:SDR family oxidoreductase [uncultured Tateyamaria sp.]